MTTVIRSLEHALELARGGELAGLAMCYLDSEHSLYECLEGKDALSAVTLLGQGTLMIEDLRGLTRELRDRDRNQ